MLRVHPMTVAPPLLAWISGFSVISDNVTSPQRSNETLRGIRIAGEDLHNVTSVTVEVVARHVVPGNLQGHLGTDGDRLGFALAVMGVERAPPGPQDQDADGVLDDVDVCLNVPGGPVDANADGCPDDRDEDGVNDADDACPEEDARPADADLDGCLDDGDGDGVPNHIDACPNTEPDLAWPTKADGCRPVDVVPVLEATLLRPELRPDEEIEVVVSVVDDDGDGEVDRILGHRRDSFGCQPSPSERNGVAPHGVERFVVGNAVGVQRFDDRGCVDL